VAKPDTVPAEVWNRIADAGIEVMRIPTPFQVGRVNCYLIEDEPLTLIDAGPNSGKALDELEHQLDALGHRVEDIDLVILTHQHIDHLGLVDIIARRAGAEVAAIDVVVPFVEDFGGDAERDDREAAALMLRHGVSEDVVRALQTVSGSFRAWGSKVHVTRPLRDGEALELRDAERRILIAADHLIKHISSNPLISRPLDGSSERTQALVAYLESLQKTRQLPAEIVLSGHGEPITDHVALIDERFALHQRRAEKLYGLISEQPRTGHELAQAMWGNVAVTQAFLTLSEVIGHVDLLINAGHVREAPDGDIVRYEATSNTPADQLGDLIPGGNPVLGEG
jgi:glyoxylase-like metal-dependent hydrolase (beta-lactamase superfamily II)